ncbi:TPR domain protein [Thelonectria olida]|uniref:TPR domain protein n=1 Tax=Thelonectria olida TaxID=1576542 RepID=A0A9P8VYX0_9HYPO|nr:TPR domain protein [Thelonectria olida]
MDVQDVSHESGLVALLKQVQDAAERGSRRKGERVRDHRSPEQLISNFVMNLMQSTNNMDGFNAIATTQVPAAYTPCILSLTELKPIMISEMRLETHHRGTSVLLRVLTPPNRMTALMAIAEDEQRTAVLLQLYHQPEERVVPADEILKADKVCVLKEPFFKCATDGSYSLRADHVSDIVWLDEADERIPSKWRKPASNANNSSKSIRTQGNDAVQNRDWAKAQRLYSSAIRAAETPEEEQLAFLNRSLANLRLGRPEQAMLDATRGSDAAAPSEKRLYREARALYELENFEKCLEKLQTLEKLNYGNGAVQPEIHRAKERLHEQQTGEYAFDKMYKQARVTPPIIDCATFSKSVEVRPSPGRGRGLFTTKTVTAGELLLCEKAFSYCHEGSDQPDRQTRVLMNLTTKRMTMGSQANLLTQVIQKLYHNSQLSASFGDLYCADYPKVSVSESDGLPVVDSFLVEKIISLNVFGAPRTSQASFSKAMSRSMTTKPGETSTHTTSGIWSLASRINHSCASNCRRSFIGDMQIVRATRDIPADTEIFFCYCVPDPLESYDDVQKKFDNWGFTCDCELCADRKATTREVLERRKIICKKLKDVLGDHHTTNAPKARRLLKTLEATYSAKEANAVRLEVWDPCFALGEYSLSKGQPVEAIKMMVKGLEALGYEMTASPTKGDAKPPRLEVTRWGLANDWVPWAFFNLFKAYKQLAPELCSSAKGYVERSYSMVVGEKETAGDIFPGLK